MTPEDTIHRIRMKFNYAKTCQSEFFKQKYFAECLDESIASLPDAIKTRDATLITRYYCCTAKYAFYAGDKQQAKEMFDKAMQFHQHCTDSSANKIITMTERLLSKNK